LREAILCLPQKPRRRQGPYCYCTAKVAGQTLTRMLGPAARPLYRQGIQNLRRLEAILKRMQRISLQALQEVGIRSKA